MGATDVIVPRAARGGGRLETLLAHVKRSDLKEFSRGIVASSFEVCDQALGFAGIPREQIGTLLLTGGTTRIPFVREEVERFFGIDALVGPSPEHSVVIGAALHAATLTGVELPDDLQQALFMFGGNRAQPIGLAMADGSTERLFEGTEALPAAAHRVYSTSRDGQRACRIEVVAGRSPRTRENRPVGQLVVDGLPLGEAGVVSLDVYFELDSRQRLRVKVVERSTGQQVKAVFDVGPGSMGKLHAA